MIISVTAAAWLVFSNYAIPFSTMDDCITAQMEVAEQQLREQPVCIPGEDYDEDEDAVGDVVDEQ